MACCAVALLVTKETVYFFVLPKKNSPASDRDVTYIYTYTCQGLSERQVYLTNNAERTSRETADSASCRRGPDSRTHARVS